MARRRASLASKVHDYLAPHKRSRGKPHFFGAPSLTALLVGVLVLEGAYFATVKLIFPYTDFLASVLPATLISLTNEDRTDNGLGSVTEDPLLDQAAQLKAEDMASKGYFAHVSPEGKDPWYWFAQVGYSYSHAGENLAVNFTDSEDVEEAWMASPTHHANIVKPQYTRIGIGVANGTYKGHKAVFVAQLFATPAAAAAAEPEPEPIVEAVPAPKPAPVKIAESPAPTRVLGTESESAPTPVEVAPTKVPEPSASWLTEVATSPAHAVEFVLFLLLAITLALFGYALLRRAHVAHPRLILGGSLAAAAIVIALFTTFKYHPMGDLPLDTQSASVINSLAQ